jgi:hypothetical protein
MTWGQKDNGESTLELSALETAFLKDSIIICKHIECKEGEFMLNVHLRKKEKKNVHKT